MWPFSLWAANQICVWKLDQCVSERQQRYLSLHFSYCRSCSLNIHVPVHHLPNNCTLNVPCMTKYCYSAMAQNFNIISTVPWVCCKRLCESFCAPLGVGRGLVSNVITSSVFVTFNITCLLSFCAHNELLTACERHRNAFYLQQLWGKRMYKRKEAELSDSYQTKGSLRSFISLMTTYLQRGGGGL